MCNCPENVFCSAQLCAECVAEFEAQQAQDFEDDEFEDDYDGQPTEYDEWQDFYGGDDWDHGQFDSYDGE